jgi:hypothetical protein
MHVFIHYRMTVVSIKQKVYCWINFFCMAGQYCENWTHTVAEFNRVVTCDSTVLCNRFCHSTYWVKAHSFKDYLYFAGYLAYCNTKFKYSLHIQKKSLELMCLNLELMRQATSQRCGQLHCYSASQVFALNFHFVLLAITQYCTSRDWLFFLCMLKFIYVGVLFLSKKLQWSVWNIN